MKWTFSFDFYVDKFDKDDIICLINIVQHILSQ